MRDNWSGNCCGVDQLVVFEYLGTVIRHKVNIVRLAGEKRFELFILIPAGDNELNVLLAHFGVDPVELFPVIILGGI